MAQLPAVQQKAITIRDDLFTKKEQFAAALPKWLSADRLLRVVFSSLLKNPSLLECTRESLFISVMACAQLGLEPILGRAYLIPYKNNRKNVTECQMQAGYQGLIDLARRTGQIKDVAAEVVYEKDVFDIEYGTNRHLTHKPYILDDPGKALGAYTIWWLKDGSEHFEFMPLYKIHQRRDMSQAYQYAIANPKNKSAQDTPWIKWPDEMIKKTAIKNHAKLMPASIEFMEAIEMDNAADMGMMPQMMDGALGFLETPDESGKEMGVAAAAVMFDDDQEIPKGEKMDAYLKANAENYDCPVEEVKANAMANKAAFLDSFKTWCDQLKPPEKTEPDNGDPWRQFRNSFINLRKSGYSTFVHKNKDLFTDQELPSQILAEAKAKWNNFYNGEPWPYDQAEPPGGDDSSVPPHEVLDEHGNVIETHGKVNQGESSTVPEQLSRMEFLDAMMKLRARDQNKFHEKLFQLAGFESFNDIPNDPNSMRNILDTMRMEMGEI